MYAYAYMRMFVGAHDQKTKNKKRLWQERD